MRNLILMVGPPGSGKTTYSSRIEGYLRLNQDEMGRFQHLEIFRDLLPTGESMIIDRMNLSRSQRRHYIDQAKKHGYKVEIVVIEEEYDVCLDRCMNRKDHETINNELKAKAAIGTFFSTYERPTDEEANAISFVKKIKHFDIQETSKLAPYEELVKQGYLRKSEKGNLVLYGYTDKCTFDRNWNEYTRNARGLIFDKKTQEIVAKPFPKFFNLGETQETLYPNLPTIPYTAHEKLDGSLGIIFYYSGQWQIATRGSFYSEQALKGAEIMEKYDFTYVPKNITLLVEIIYPKNKVIIDYGKQEKLVLLGGYNPALGVEILGNYLKAYTNVTGMEIAQTFDLTIEEMIGRQKNMTKDEEGFVVRFDNGLRVKIKGDEYMRIARLVSNMTPLAFWESMKNGFVKTEYLQQLPEEFRNEYEPIVEGLQNNYKKVSAEIIEDAKRLPITDEEEYTSPDVRRRVGLFLKRTSLKHKAIMFYLLFGKMDAVEEYTMKMIRPTKNELRILE